MIEVSGLSKHYGEGEARKAVLDDVTLTIEEGEFVAIVGTSGSGKTTLLNIVGGLDHSWSGEVEVAGSPLREMSDRELAKMRNERFGFIFQQFNLLDHLTALENVLLPAFFGEDADSGVRDRAKDLLETLGLGDKIDDRPPQLSGGQKQRVAIARSLLQKPDIILCDEPTGSLDRDTGLSVLEVFERLNVEEEITIVMVTHEEHIAELARRIIRLEDGAVVGDERTDSDQSSKASSSETSEGSES